MTIRFGMVGGGRWGMCHAEAIRSTEGAELAAVAVSSPESARRLETELAVPAVIGWPELLARSDLGIDLVDIVAPNALHGDIALASLAAGKHVLVEKPMATTVAACDAIVDAADRANRVVAVGHELRLSPLWGRVKAEISSGRIGRPLSCTIHLWRRSFRAGASGWRHDPEQVGSWILEEPIHYFDLARWYLTDLGEPTSVYARGSGRGPSLKENVAAIVSWDGGFASISQTTAGAEHHLLAEVTGTIGSLRLIWAGASDRSEVPAYHLHLALDDVLHELQLEGTPTETGDLRRQLASLVRCLTDGGPPPVDAAEGRWAVRLVLAAEESTRTGRPVTL